MAEDDAREAEIREGAKGNLPYARPHPHIDVAFLIRRLNERDSVISDLSMMLRRMIWQAKRQEGDTSLKVLAGNAHQLLAKYSLEGDILRDTMDGSRVS